MQRRALLRGLASLAATGSLAGCPTNREVPVTAPPPTDEGSPPDRRETTTTTRRTEEPTTDTPTTTATPTPTSSPRPIVFPDPLSTGETEGGKLVVSVAVKNRGSTTHAFVLNVELTREDGDDLSNARALELQADAETTVGVELPIDRQTYIDEGGGIKVRVIPGTPETPTPTLTTTSADGISVDGSLLAVRPFPR